MKLIMMLLACCMGLLGVILTGCEQSRPKEINSTKLSPTYYYKNPGSIKNIGDPFVLKASDGKYYCYPTSGFKVWSSYDLVNWKQEGSVKPSNMWGVMNFWAPEVVEHNGKYYMYYSARLTEDRPTSRIAVAVSDSPVGPFEDIGRPMFDLYHVIDAHVFIDEDGKKYLYFSRDGATNIIDGRNESHLYGVELNEDMISIKGEPKFLLKPEQQWELASGPKRLWNEGPFVMKRNGTYYLMYSANVFAGAKYSVGYATSNEPLGPYTKYENNPVLSNEEWTGKVAGPGHHSVTVSPDGKELFIIYHTHTNPKQWTKSRQINIDRMGFREDGTIYVNGPTLTEQPMPSGVTDLVNLSSYAEVTASSTKPSYRTTAVTDGEIGIYKRLEQYEWVSDGENAEAWVKLEWNKKQKISSIWLYNSAVDSRKVHLGKLIFSNGDEINSIELPTQPGEATIVNFDEIEVKWVKFVVVKTVVDGGEAGISEIMVFGKSIN